jgi:uncharacterized protein YchJ
MPQIEKSTGVTKTERDLATLCDRTFLNLWHYPNPYKSDGKELCDLLVVFGNNVFLFFDRESRVFERPDKDQQVLWERWRRTAIDAQIATAKGAKRYLTNPNNAIFLDANCTKPFPIAFDRSAARIFKIVVAHGAKEACKASSDANVSGSLAVTYGEPDQGFCWPFLVELDRNDPVHVLDSENLPIVLSELDTAYDLATFLAAKETAIAKFKFLSYCGEEDLLAHYFCNYDEAKSQYVIGPPAGKPDDYDGIFIGEGEWRSFVASDAYARRKEANKSSYLWDRLLQRTGANALSGELRGDDKVFEGKSAILEMAKEPRVSRRGMSDAIIQSIRGFPEHVGDGVLRNVSFFESFFKGTGYVFLQLSVKHIRDYDNDYRPKRQALLLVACGAAKNKVPHLTKVVGIAIDAPRYAGNRNSEDFILLDCANWTEHDRKHYEELNEDLRFFRTDKLKVKERHITEFPAPERSRRSRKIGRNEPCPCGSGKKFKRCCGAKA